MPEQAAQYDTRKNWSCSSGRHWFFAEVTLVRVKRGREGAGEDAEGTRSPVGQFLGREGRRSGRVVLVCMCLCVCKCARRSEWREERNVH